MEELIDALSYPWENGFRHLGVTSHSLGMALKLIHTGLFSTVQFPFNFIEMEALQELHPQARELGLGIPAMKPFAGGMVDNARVVFKFLRQFLTSFPWRAGMQRPG